MNDFRTRLGAQLGAAAARLLRATAEADFRARLGVQLTQAATLLAGERQAALGAPPLLAGDFRARFALQLGAAAAGLAAERPSARTRVPRRRRIWRRQRAGGVRRGRPDFRARLGIQLTAAAGLLAGEHEAAASIGRRSRVGAMPRLVLPARLGRPLAVGLGLTVLAGAATASSLWLVQVGNPNYGYSPGVSASAPPAAQLAALAVLRRPQSTGDRGPGVQAALQDVNNFTTGVRINYVRVLETTREGPVVLVPVARRDPVQTGALPARPAISDALCVYYPTPGTGGLVEVPACWSLAQVIAGTANAVNAGHLYGLAPDGTSTVTVSPPGGAAPVRVAVSDNFFDVTDGAAAGGLPPLPAAPSGG